MLVFFLLSKKNLKGLKSKKFIIIGIKNIFKLLVNGDRLMVGNRTKTFENVWIKIKRQIKF